MPINSGPRRVSILAGSRIPFVKSFGPYARTSNFEMLTPVLKDLVDKASLRGEALGEVALGAVMLFPTDFNLAREVTLESGLSPDTPAYNVQRACGTSLEASNHIALKIAAGQIEAGIAGGSDTNSDLPILFPKPFAWKLLDLRAAGGLGARISSALRFRMRDVVPVFPAVREPRTGLSMGDHTEQMVKEWKISREAQDELAYLSHKNAGRALGEGFFNDLLIPFRGVDRDTILRPDTSIEKLARLKPAFDRSGAGTLTAGNSTPLSDGASAVLLASDEWAQRKRLEPWAHFVDCEAAAVDFVGGEGLLMAPTIAVHRLLERNKLKLQDFDFYEIHEAFAGQVLCTLKAWEDDAYCKRRMGAPRALGPIDRSRMNVNGSSLGLGHPFAATGSRIVATGAKLLKQKGSGRCLISICTAGGMGVAAILER